MYYHRITFDVDRNDLLVIRKYEMAGFNLTALWRGMEVGAFPSSLKLIVDDTEEGEMPDLFGNPVSWLVVSDKLAEILCQDQRKGTVQLIPAPIFRDSDGSKVEGYQVLNPLVRIDCLNEAKSKLGRLANGALAALDHCVLNQASIPENIGIFRLGEFPKAIFVSDELAHRTCQKGLRGLAYFRCNAI